MTRATSTATATAANPVQAMPTAEPSGPWTRVYSNDFTTATAVGTWTPDTNGFLPSTHPYFSTMKAYPDNNGYAGDQGIGLYYSSKVISTRTDVANANGVLQMYLHGETLGGVFRFLSGWIIPRITGHSELFTGGRFSIRYRLDSMPRAGGVHLLISDNWPQGGEDDWMEDDSTVTPVGGNVHYADPAATSGTSNNYTLRVNGPTGSTYQDWHVATIEWYPGTRRRYLLDGVVLHDSTDRVSNVPQKWIPYQSGISGVTIGGSKIPDPATAGNVQIDWITAADYTPSRATSTATVTVTNPSTRATSTSTVIVNAVATTVRATSTTTVVASAPVTVVGLITWGIPIVASTTGGGTGPAPDDGAPFADAFTDSF